MQIVLFAKEGKPGVREVIDYLGACNFDIISYLGKLGDKFPKEALEYSPDIIVSYLSPWIIPKDLLAKTKKWNINFHPGPPEYPGIGCTNFAIYNGEKIYGVTAHIMEEKVDSGKIIKVKRFELLESDNVFTVTLKSYAYLLVLFFEVFDNIIKYGKLPETNEKWKRKPYTRKELEDLCKINNEMSKEEVERRIRATYFPGMPGAYIEIFGHKFEYNKKR